MFVRSNFWQTLTERRMVSLADGKTIVARGAHHGGLSLVVKQNRNVKKLHDHLGHRDRRRRRSKKARQVREASIRGTARKMGAQFFFALLRAIGVRIFFYCINFYADVNAGKRGFL
jgi:hypothetical protein